MTSQSSPDIVDALRNLGNTLANGSGKTVQISYADIFRAADEIERLRASQCSAGTDDATISAIHDALAKAGLEYSGYSCNGVNLVGDKASVKAATTAFHSHSQIDWYQTNLRHWREECGKLHAKLAQSPSAAQPAGVREALELAEDVLSRRPFSSDIWPNGMHPQTGIEKIRAALAMTRTQALEVTDEMLERAETAFYEQQEGPINFTAGMRAAIAAALALPSTDRATVPPGHELCSSCGRLFKWGETCSRGGCPCGGDV